MTARPILFVDHAPALGGAEKSLLLLLQHLEARRWQKHLAGVTGALLDSAAELGVATHNVSLPRLRRSPAAPAALARGVRALRQAALSTGSVAIYANTVRAAFYAAPAARLARRPFIWHMRDFWLSETRPSRPGVDRLVKRLLVGAATAVITNSHAVAAQMPRTSKVQVIHNGIDLSPFDPTLSGATFRDSYEVPGDAPLVVTVGRLRPWKGQRNFIAMAAAVHEARPDVHFAIVGGAPFGDPDGYTASLREEAQARGLGDVVHLTGQLADVRPALAAADIFVHPGDPEPFGLVNVEAMAMGRPVVAYAHGALPEIVADGVTGRLIPPGGTSALASAVQALLEDREGRRQMGAAGRERAARLFDIRRVAAEVDALLQQVTG